MQAYTLFSTYQLSYITITFETQSWASDFQKKKQKKTESSKNEMKNPFVLVFNYVSVQYFVRVVFLLEGQL